MSQNLSGLAGDFASFYNLSTNEAFDKIRAGISGETEPLKQLGIDMSVTSLEAYALAQGIKVPFDKMSQGNKTILRYNYLMEKSRDAPGDFTRTQDSFANQTRLLQ
ncbi:MAG TPA: DNA-binding protein, partial [Bacilli bacterium]